MWAFSLRTGGDSLRRSLLLGQLRGPQGVYRVLRLIVDIYRSVHTFLGLLLRLLHRCATLLMTGLVLYTNPRVRNGNAGLCLCQRLILIVQGVRVGRRCRVGAPMTVLLQFFCMILCYSGLSVHLVRGRVNRLVCVKCG